MQSSTSSVGFTARASVQQFRLMRRANTLKDLCFGIACFLLTLLCFYRRDLFFCLDDYVVIWSWVRARSIPRYLFALYNEHFLPLAKLFYAIEIVFFRQHYGLYILTNCALMAITAVLWKKFLQRLGCSAWLATAIPLVACTSIPSQDSIVLAWQACLILSAASLIAAFWAWLDDRLYACAFFLAVSALTFSNVIPVCAVVGGYLLRDGFIRKDRRLLIGGGSMLALFALLIACQRTLAVLLGVGLSLRESVWSQPTLWANLSHLGWLAYYTLTIALAGPFLQFYWQLTGQSAPDNVSFPEAVLGLGGAALLLLLVWRSRVRQPSFDYSCCRSRYSF